MKNKGFTMIELLATIVLLGIIMMIAVPSITSILAKNKKQTFLNDAKKFVALAEQEARKSGYKYDCYTLNASNHVGSCYNISTQDIEKSPYDEMYLESSRVLLCQVGGSYYYKVYLTDGNKSIEGLIKIADKDKSKLGKFNNIEEENDKKFDFIRDYRSSYTISCN